MDLNTSCEPMDVDLSSNSVNAMDISYNEECPLEVKMVEEKSGKKYYSPKRSVQQFKKLEVNLSPRQNKTSHSYLIYIGIVFFLFSIIIHQVSVNIKCNGSLDIEKIKNKFDQRLYGQKTATSKLVKSLESSIENKMIIMYGQTGVGKTLSVSLIIEDLLTFSNVYHYTMPTLIDKFHTDLLLGFAFCDNSIFVIDDLKNNDTLKVRQIVQSILTKSKNLNRNVLIILVYNCVSVETVQMNTPCAPSFHSELSMMFKDIDILKEFIEFSQLQGDTLRKCIEYELGNKKISSEMFENIQKNFDVYQDGCKSVHQKMKYLNVL